MNPQGRIPRSRGGICGVLLILLGLWGGLAPFVGPYFHFGFTPDKAWAYNSGRLYYSVIPGAAVLLGGLFVAATRNRGVGAFGGVLASLGGAWFVGGQDFVLIVLKRVIVLGAPIFPAYATSPRLWAYLESVGLFTGLGVLVLFLGALAVGRFSMLSASDAAAEADSYYADFPATPTAGQPDPSQFPSPAGGYPSVAGQFDTAATQYPPPESLT